MLSAHYRSGLKKTPVFGAHIRGDQGIRVMVDLMSGHLRTPKHAAVQKAVRWYNNRMGQTPSTRGKTITLQPVSSEPICNDAWFAGFADADGCTHSFMWPF